MNKKKLTILIITGMILVGAGSYFLFFTDEPLINFKGLDTPTPLVERDSIPENRIEMLKNRAKRERDSLRNSYWEGLSQELEEDTVQTEPENLLQNPNSEDKRLIPSNAQPEVIIKYVEVPAKKTAQAIAKPKPKPRRRRNGFVSESDKIVTYAVNRNPVQSGGIQNASLIRSDEYFKAIVHEDQQVRKGNTVKLRLLEDGYVNGVRLEKNMFLYGIVSISQNRVMIDVQSVLIDSEVKEISLTAYEKDGLRGIYIPGAVEKEIKDDVLNNVVSDAASRVNIPLIGSAARRSASKKIRDQVVDIPNGHEVILRAVSL